MVVVDAHTKWPEVVQMGSTTAEETVEHMRTLMARMGIPEQVVTDNGPQFTSGVFRAFMKKNGIQHVTGAPYHPATNGLAERLVQSVKRAVKANKSGTSLQHKLDEFLLAYRVSPHAVTEQSPAQLMYGRKLRTKLDLLKPDVRTTVQQKQIQDSTRAYHTYENGQSVMARNYRAGPPWLPGTVVDVTGPVSYKVAVNGAIWRRHTDQLRSGS